MTNAERCRKYRDKLRGGPPGSGTPPGRPRSGTAMTNRERQRRHRDKVRGGPSGSRPGRPRLLIGDLIKSGSWHTWSNRRRAFRRAAESREFEAGRPQAPPGLDHETRASFETICDQLELAGVLAKTDAALLLRYIRAWESNDGGLADSISKRIWRRIPR